MNSQLCYSPRKTAAITSTTEYHCLTLNQENGSVLPLSYKPTQHAPSQRMFQEKNGNISNFKMLPSERLVKTAGTKDAQNPVLKIQTTLYRKKD